ncbi:MAG: adenylyltransferase/cytidyltransferase family protein [Methanomassiliicoccales archaeon]|jgi:pantetheine-phosphate adenylyltransferase
MNTLSEDNYHFLLNNNLLRKLSSATRNDVTPLVIWLDEMLEKWNEPHRHYHTIKHLDYILGVLKYWPKILDQETREELAIIALFHDIIYDSRSQNNEEASAEFFMSSTHDVESTGTSRSFIRHAILDTKTHRSNDKISNLFFELDLWELSHGTWPQLLKMEREIFLEYQFVPYDVYKTKRIEILTQLMPMVNNNSNMVLYIEYLSSFRPHIGVYAGSFDPFHLGHLNILQKAEKLFDKVIIAVATDPSKSSDEPLNRKRLLEKQLPCHQIDIVEKFLTNHIRVIEGVADITLIRGLRNGYDLSYEMNLLRYMEDQYNELKVVWIPCDRKYEYVSSRDLRGLGKIEEGSELSYLPQQNSAK